MSRCFPFPPPGYMRNGARSDALIESIKLQREMEKAKKDRKKEKKEKKKEKDHRKKEKKERKLKEGGTSSHRDDGKKFKHIDDLKDIKADGKLLKGEDFENEQLERSGITEEHEQPVSSREPCCLSDSTESSKRKRSSISPSSSHDHGTAIRIRLPLKKHKEPEQAKRNQLGSSNSLIQRTGSSVHQSHAKPNQLGSSNSLIQRTGSSVHQSHAKPNQLGSSNSLIQRTASSVHQLQAKPNQLGSSNSLIQGTGPSVHQRCVPNAEPNLSLGNSDSGHCKTSQTSIHGDSLVTNTTTLDVEGQRMESLYNSLLQIPLTIEALDSDDQDWLFSSDLTEAKRASKKVKSVTDAVRCSTPSLWPHAQYLHEVDMYALPYTVPF